MLLERKKNVVKRVKGIRWYSRYDANKNFYEGWKEIMEALTSIENAPSEKSDVRCKAAGLKSKLSRFESVFVMIFWNDLLKTFFKTNESLQSVNIDLGVVVDLYQGLISFCSSLRSDEMFAEYLEKARGITEEVYDVKRTCKLLSGDSRENLVVLTGRDKLKIEVYFAALDKVQIELRKRQAAYETVFKRFHFLVNIGTNSLNDDELRKKAEEFQKLYEDDIEDSFPIECLNFRIFLKNAKYTEGFKNPDFSKFLKMNNLEDAFANISVAFRIFLSLAVTNCSSERSFSYLKRLKSYVRSSLIEEKLNSLALLTIESDLTNLLQFDDIIDNFAAIRSRKKII